MRGRLVEGGCNERPLRRPTLLLLCLSKAHSLRLVVADVVLDLLEVSQFVSMLLLLLNLFYLLLILGRPHLVCEGARLVHYGHLPLQLQVELVTVLEEGVIRVDVVAAVEVHVVEAVGVLLLQEKLVDDPPGNFLPEHVLFLVQILHLLLFPDFLKLGPIIDE